MWKILQAIVLFGTVGVLLSTSVLEDIGIKANPLLVVAVSLGITTMLMYRSMLSLLVMVLFCLLIVMPDATLELYNLDRQMLMAAAIALLCLPWIKRFMDS